MQLVWSPGFSRELKRLVRRNPQLRGAIERTLEQLSENPFHPALKTHKLKGDLPIAGLVRSTTVIELYSGSYRILIQRKRNFCFWHLALTMRFTKAKAWAIALKIKIAIASWINVI